MNIPFTYIVICNLIAFSASAADGYMADTPRFIGSIKVGSDTYVILGDKEKKEAPKWLKVGQKFGEFEILDLDNQKDSLILGRGRDTFAVAIESAKIKDGKGENPAGSREQGLRLAHQWLELFEQQTLTDPFYFPLDLTYEGRLTPSQKEYVNGVRERAKARGNKVFVTEWDGGVFTITIDKVVSQLPPAKKLFQGLSEDDWAPIDERYAKLMAERIVARRRQMEQANKKSK